MVWHYHDDDVPGPVADVALSLNHLPLRSGQARLQHYRIDGEHSNAYALWQQMGSPQQPTSEQYAQLEKAGQLATMGATESVQVENGTATIRLQLPRQAVSLVVLEWSARAQ